MWIWCEKHGHGMSKHNSMKLLARFHDGVVSVCLDIGDV